MAAIMVTRLSVSGARVTDVATSQIIRLTTLGQEQAIITGKKHRLFFDFTADNPYVQLQVVEKKEDTKTAEYKPITVTYTSTKFLWPSMLAMKNFYIHTVDEASKGALKTVWFFIFPDGTAQDIIMNIVDEVEHTERSLVLNPFTVKFSLYDTAQKP